MRRPDLRQILIVAKDSHTRATQVYINRVDNRQLDAQGFAPFGVVVQGMAAVEAWHGGYGARIVARR